MELVAHIVGYCLAACDNATAHAGLPTVGDMFSVAVGGAVNKEVRFFENFRSRSASGSQWIQNSQTIAGSAGENEPDFVGRLLDVYPETSLLEEVKDIKDELIILSQIVKEQDFVLRKLIRIFESIGTTNSDMLPYHSTPSMTEKRGLFGEEHSRV